MTRQALHALMEEAMFAFSPYYRTVTTQTIQESGMAGPPWAVCFQATGSDPEPFTPQAYLALNPLNALDELRQRLEQTAEGGFMERVGEDAYRLTDKGRAGVARFFAIAHEAMNDLAPLPDAEMARLTALLRRAVEAVAQDPAPKPLFALSRTTDPGPEAGYAPRIDQYLTDLRSFREDVHFALIAGQDEVSMPGWETLTLIWRDDYASVAPTLGRRGYEADAIDAALAELTAKGWIAPEGDGYQATEAGGQYRREAEDATDRGFYIWRAALSDDEIAEMETLLVRMRGELRLSALTSDTWATFSGLSGALYPLYRDKTGPLMAEVGFDPSFYFFYVMEAIGFDHVNAPTTPEVMARRYPYLNPATCRERYEAMVEAGFLSRTEDGAYRLTDKGRAGERRINAAFYGELGAIQARIVDHFSPEDLNRLLELLRRVAGAVLDAPETPPETPEKWAVKTTLSHDPGEVAALGQLDFQMDILAAYRDDVHLHAFRQRDVDAHAFEAFTFIWRGELDTAAALAERLSFRGYTAEDYARALDELVERGWLTQEGEAYRLTDAGQQVRDEVEAQTNRAFFTPWLVLSPQEMETLTDLFERLLASLRRLHADDVAAARKDLFDLRTDASGALYELAREVVEPADEEVGLAALVDEFLAHARDPELVSADFVVARAPYTSIGAIQEWLAALAEKGYVQDAGDGQYRITTTGRQARQFVLDKFYTRLEELEPLPAAELETLESLLTRVTEACLDADDPPGTTSVAILVNAHLGKDRGAMSRINYRLDLLSAFRDDAHLAAWQPHEVSGPAWECLTLVWRGEADTPAAVVEERPYRGYTAEDYGAAFAGLVERGWLEKAGETYRITDAGRAVREEAEAQTDRYYYLPWAALNDEETAQLRDLLTHLTERLKAMAAQEPA